MLQLLAVYISSLAIRETMDNEEKLRSTTGNHQQKWSRSSRRKPWICGNNASTSPQCNAFAYLVPRPLEKESKIIKRGSGRKRAQFCAYPRTSRNGTEEHAREANPHKHGLLLVGASFCALLLTY